MIDLQNLSYAVVQVAHNFGAVAVAGGPACVLLGASHEASRQRKAAWVVGGGWLAQGLSGLGFGVVSYASYGALPDIHGIALAALYTKMLCALGGITTSYLLARCLSAWTESRCRRTWQLLLLLGVIALSAAAFLRWFS